MATVTLAVVAQADFPVANDNDYTVNEDETRDVAVPGVLINDTDADGDALSAILVDDVANGTLVLNGNGSFSYTPNLDFNGTDNFTYKANDGLLDSNVATVTIMVGAQSDPPVANDEGYVVNEDEMLNVAGPGVLANDTDTDGDPLLVLLTQDVDNGLLVLNGDGSFSYTPDVDFSGTDRFTYKANDGLVESNLATVTITVNPVNDPPIANDDGFAVNEDVVRVGGVLGNDTDVEGDSLSVQLVDDVDNGTLTLHADGSFTYTPDVDFSGTDSFTYTANDETDDSNVATVAITVNPQNDAPVANDDGYAVNEDTTLSVPAMGLLANDMDIDSGSLTALLISDVRDGSLILHADGSFTYTPNVDFNGTDSFTYKANDGSMDSDVATVTITINAMNDAPVAHDDEYVVEERGALTVTREGVLANDVDVDSDSLTAVLVNNVSDGSLTLNADGSFAYTPDTNFTGTDSFTYMADDGTDESNLATVTITVESSHIIGTFESGSNLKLVVGGKKLTFRLRGEGIGEVFDTGEGLIDLTLTDTTKRSRATIRGEGSINDIVVRGSLKFLMAPDIDLLGDLVVTGTIGTVVMDDIDADHTITIGEPAGPRDRVSFIFDDVTDLNIDSRTPINKLQVTRWRDKDALPDVIKAPSLGLLNAKGHRRNGVAGDFEAGLDLDGTDGARQTLASAKISGAVRGTAWHITGDTGSVQIDGPVDDWSLNVMRSLKSLRLRDVGSATVSVDDVIGSVGATRWMDGSIDADAVKSIRVTGNRRNHIDGDFNAGLDLRGSADPSIRQTLGSARIAGGVRGSAWRLSGDSGTVQIEGIVKDWTLDVMSNLKGLKLGDVERAEVNVEDNIGAVKGMRWMNGALGAASVRSIQTSGDRRHDVAGDFAAHVTLTGAADAKAALGGARIAGALTRATWRVQGAAGAIAADSVGGLFTANIVGDLKALNVKSDSAGAIVAETIGTLKVGGNLVDAMVIAGGSLGPDGELGGGDDAFAPGVIGRISIGGMVDGSSIRVGFDHVDGVYDNGNDVLIGGSLSEIKSMSIGGDANGDSVFFGGAFPAAVKIKGANVDPLTDGRFHTRPL